MNTNHIKELALNDNGFLFDPTTGYSYNTNELGIVILKQLIDGKTKDEILSSILDEYDVSFDNINHDFDHYLLQLDALNLLEVTI